jgi:hypothetical protein
MPNNPSEISKYWGKAKKASLASLVNTGNATIKMTETSLCATATTATKQAPRKPPPAPAPLAKNIALYHINDTHDTSVGATTRKTTSATPRRLSTSTG